MSKLKGNYDFVSQEPIYTSNGNWGFEVVQDDPIRGVTHYLIDSENNIIEEPIHIEGTSIFEKGQDFYIKNQGKIVGVPTLIVIGGSVLFLTKNPSLAKTICQISTKAIKDVVRRLGFNPTKKVYKNKDTSAKASV